MGVAMRKRIDSRTAKVVTVIVACVGVGASVWLSAAEPAAPGQQDRERTPVLQSLQAQQQQQSDQQQPEKNRPDGRMLQLAVFPDGFKGAGDWVVVGTPRVFNKGSLYGYIDGGAELFLTAGFRRSTIFDLVPKGASPDGPKRLTLEIYEMETRDAAAGIFKTRRVGDEYVSPRLETVHWIESKQANFISGVFYVNILAAGCTQNEVEEFTLDMVREMPPARSPVPLDLGWLPREGIVPGSENYVAGDKQALALAPFLSSPVWGLAAGTSEAYSVEYGPGQSSLVLIKFKETPPNLKNEVVTLFGNYLAQVTEADDLLQGVNMTGRYYLFGQYGNTGVLILGEPDLKAARKRLADTLAALARKDKNEKEKKSPEKK